MHGTKPQKPEPDRAADSSSYPLQAAGEPPPSSSQGLLRG